MIAAIILLVTVLMAVMIGLRYVSPAFRTRMELPKHRFQASLESTYQESADNEDRNHAQR